MRLFAGLDLPYEMRRNLELLLHLVKPLARIQWSPVANLHLTTKFIGDFPEQRLEELKSALAAAPRPGTLRIAIRGLGWFPDPKRPRIFFAGIEAPPEMAQLARDTEAACAALGIPREDKPFRPHLTLARIRHPEPLTMLQDAIAGLPGTDFGAFQADNFHLYRSQLDARGSIYTKLASFPLAL
ncbi:MAG: RNA 2',3'-cyclic phosphodiesterase [Bryobacteraceae bacterium]